MQTRIGSVMVDLITNETAAGHCIEPTNEFYYKQSRPTVIKLIARTVSRGSKVVLTICTILPIYFYSRSILIQACAQYGLQRVSDITKKFAQGRLYNIAR